MADRKKPLNQAPAWLYAISQSAAGCGTVQDRQVNPARSLFFTQEIAMRLSPLKSIRAYCLDCSGDSRNEVKLCQIPDCPLYQYRMGKTGRKVVASPQSLKALAEYRRKKSLADGSNSE
jgi:hypothetical protein